MSKRTEKSQRKSNEEIREEIRQLTEKANRLSGTQLLLPDLDDNEDVGFDTSALYDTANPDLSHRLFYSMRRIMMENLPNDKKVRKYIYDEKNLFLNRGKDKDQNGIRHSDGRMSYISGFLEVAFEITVNWLRSGASPFDLYEAFWKKNEEFGFHKDDRKLSSFNKSLKAALDHNPKNESPE